MDMTSIYELTTSEHLAVFYIPCCFVFLFPPVLNHFLATCENEK